MKKLIDRAIAYLILIIAGLLILGAVIAPFAWCMTEHDKESFDTELVGKEHAIVYATYYRTHPRKDATKMDHLSCGDTVTTTGGVSKRWCPSTTCPCGGKSVWVQVIDNDGDLYWIEAEAYGG